jgi:hypothetical protein
MESLVDSYGESEDVVAYVPETETLFIPNEQPQTAIGPGSIYEYD